MRAPQPDEGGHYALIGDDPRAVRTLERSVDDAARGLHRLAASVSAAVPRLLAAWPEGPAGEAAAHDVGVTADYVARAPAVLESAAQALGSYADALVVVGRRVEDLGRAHDLLAPAEATLGGIPLPPPPERLLEWEVADSDLALARSRSGFRSTTEIDLAYAALARQVERHRDECAGALERLAATDTLLGSVRGASALAGQLVLLTAGGLTAFLGRAGLSALPTSPEQVRAFWATLSSAERETLVRNDPRMVGALAGVPVVDRDRANRLVRTADEAQGVQLLRSVGIAVPTSVSGLDALLAHLSPAQVVALGSLPGPWGAGRMLLPEVKRRLGVYRNALAVARALTAGPAAYLVTYDAAAYSKRSVPEGRAAVAYGDPDTAEHVALCVPGLESRVANLDQVGTDAVALWREAAAADPAGATAVVAWQGYDAPEWTTVAGQDRAEVGGALLAADAHALTVTHQAGDPVITVVAHSYGSTTAGLALQHHGLAADVDQVALIGSPGVGGSARDVADLGLRPDQLHVATASRDLIHLASDTLLGADPLDPGFRAQRFRAESVERDGPGLLDLIGEKDHSRYYDPGSESLYSLADIASGHADQLGPHGMLARAPTTWRDPEHSREPTGGHEHAVA
ncbi:alpha/beta hydrolase [Dermatophilaceae bacterium Soc4.6]